MTRFPLHIGFTGTRLGMTADQIRVVYGLLQFKDFWGHHGDCIGADATFHEVVGRCDSARGRILHPPADPTRRAYCQVTARDAVMPEKEYLERNRDIVHALLPVASRKAPYESWWFLIACPAEMKRPASGRGGTWYTYDYARELHVPTKLVLPNGMLFEESL